MSRSHADDLHFAGVHVACRPLQEGQRRGSGTSSACPLAGTVEKIHSHEFDGPLWAACGCPETP